eukprot:2465060-Rhodomonas_salina.3
MDKRIHPSMSLLAELARYALAHRHHARNALAQSRLRVFRASMTRVGTERAHPNLRQHPRQLLPHHITRQMLFSLGQIREGGQE